MPTSFRLPFGIGLAVAALWIGAPLDASHAAAAAPKETVIYDFLGGADGAQPAFGSLAADSSGALYGTTSYGGQPCGCGVVYKLTPSNGGYVESVIYSGDGAGNFIAGVLVGAGGVLYFPANGGAHGQGGVFALTPGPSGYTLSTVYSFDGPNDGSEPYGTLIEDAGGALYGTTATGGGTGCFNAGCGTVYKLTPSQGGYAETILYRFKGGRDGFDPVSGLLGSADGTLFGTTYLGGAGENGTAFSLSPESGGYVKRLLHAFGTTTSDGRFPNSALFADASGALYGTTYNGGSYAYQYGTVFKLTPGKHGKHYTESIIHAFEGSDGANPLSPVILDAEGNVYGTTRSRALGGGTVFELSPTASGYEEDVLHSFNGNDDGSGPLAGLLLQNGVLYGTTQFGGSKNLGTVFSVAL